MTQVTRYDNRVIMDVLCSLDCARALTAAILLRYAEYVQLINLSFNPFDYNDVNSARDSLQATELLRKADFLPTNIDKTDEAITAFLLSEIECKHTNNRILTSNSCGPLRFKASRKINSILGEFIPEQMFEFAGWGPGVTLTLRGRDATSYNKFKNNLECTRPLYHLLKPLWDSQFPTWPLSVREYEGNRVITVPKNAKTERTIAVEPSLNMFFQKSLGTMIRRRLARFGMDLNSQRRNQELARLGSIHSNLTTVDFSAASDTISWSTVQDLIPDFWFRVLDVLRSPRGYLKRFSSLHTYEKFSSMGNGYTFELESLIFYALAIACVPEDHPLYDSISVYGDDVIIPTDCYETYLLLCQFYGFTVNTRKSFSSSYYRESCGKHYWDGLDITPFYMRSSLSAPAEKMKLHNRIVEYSLYSMSLGVRDGRFRGVIAFLASTSEIDNQIPLGLGDMGLITCFSVATPSRNRRYQQGFNVKVRLYRPRSFSKDDHAVLLTRLYENENSQYGVDLSHGNMIQIPRAGKYITKIIYFPEWQCLGPWINPQP